MLKATNIEMPKLETQEMHNINKALISCSEKVSS